MSACCFVRVYCTIAGTEKAIGFTGSGSCSILEKPSVKRLISLPEIPAGGRPEKEYDGMITYVCGHRNPDTDSIVAAISYANLCNMLGENDYIPVRLGQLNDETAFLLNRFGFEAPVQIATVRTQVRDVEFDCPPRLAGAVPVSYAWNMMQENPNLSVLPIMNEDETLYGLITAENIAESDMQSIQTPVLRDAPIFNVLSALEGRIMNRDENVFDSLSGEVVIALPTSGETLGEVKAGSVILCGNQPDMVEKALHAGANCIILCQNDLGEKYRGVDSSTCVISTPLDAWRAVRQLFLATPVSRIAKTDEIICFHLEDYLDDVREAVLKNRHRSYPILNNRSQVVGTLSRYHLLQPRRKRIVLVDHNEVSQSVPGLEQAELVAIIDHHRLADVETGYPVFMRNEPVGSTNTIIATMYQEEGLMPPEKLAGLMAAAIVSDTVMFKSPTTTPRDRRMADRLARIAGLNLDDLGREVFSASSGADKTAETLLKTDMKEFHLGDHYLIISQITSMDSRAMLSRRDELLKEMEKLQEEKKTDMVLLMITDVLRDGTELLFLGDGEVIRQAFGLGELKNNHAFIRGLVSRKKQTVPALAQLWG